MTHVADRMTRLVSDKGYDMVDPEVAAAVRELSDFIATWTENCRARGITLGTTMRSEAFEGVAYIAVVGAVSPVGVPAFIGSVAEVAHKAVLTIVYDQPKP